MCTGLEVRPSVSRSPEHRCEEEGVGKPKLERREELKREPMTACVGKELGFCPERLGSLGRVFSREAFLVGRACLGTGPG